jgi:uncharacterized SAM-binding protein YcdF (DUF218 family)
MTEKEKYIALISAQKLKKSDVIVLLEGDGFFRCEHTFELYKQGWAKKVVISGGVLNRNYGSFPAKELEPRLIKLGVKKGDILIDDKSMNTRDQAINILALAKEKKWKRIILVASHYHQYRAFLTFLKIFQKLKIIIEIINSPANDLSWFEKNKWGRRIDLLESEFERINIYKKKNHIASYKDAINYLKSVEK